MHRKKRSRLARREALDVEHRVVRLREAVEQQHPEDGREGGAEHRRLEGRHEEGRPGVERAAADVHRVLDDGRPVLQAPAADEAQQAAGERELGHVGLVQVQRVEHLFHRVGRVGVHGAVAGGVDSLRGLHDLLRRVELGQQAVELGLAHGFSSAPLAAGTSVRISKIEIVGRKRMNRKNSVRNRPDRADEHRPVEDRPAVVAPRRRQEVAVQARDDDHEALEPHADVHDQRDDEQSTRRSCAGA